MRPLVGLKVGALGVNLLAVWKTTLVYSPLLISSSTKARVAEAQVGVGEGLQAGVGGGGRGGV